MLAIGGSTQQVGGAPGRRRETTVPLRRSGHLLDPRNSPGRHLSLGQATPGGGHPDLAALGGRGSMPGFSYAASTTGHCLSPAALRDGGPQGG
jgi:hypothetical protein